MVGQGSVRCAEGFAEGLTSFLTPFLAAEVKAVVAALFPVLFREVTLRLESVHHEVLQGEQVTGACRR